MDILSDVKITGNLTIDRLDNSYYNGGFVAETDIGLYGFVVRNNDGMNRTVIGPGIIDFRIKRLGGSMIELCKNDVFGTIRSLTIPANCSKFMVNDYCVYTDENKIDDVTDLIFPNITAWDASTLKKVEIDYELGYEGCIGIEKIFGILSNNIEEKTIIFAINPIFKSF